MRAELISIETDSQPLDGLYYEPQSAPVKGAVQLMHGNCMNFYVGALRFLPPVLVRQGYACLAYNRRGHDILSTRDSREPEGAAFQLIGEAVSDNVAAARFLSERGFPAPILIGHSNGGMLAVRHCVDHPNTPALILLSAHKGGKSVIPDASKAGLLAQDRLDVIRTEAASLVASGKGRTLLALPGWWYAISAQSLMDLLENMPDILELAPRVRCPVLALRGDREPPQLYPVEAFQKKCGGRCDVEIVVDCDHFYVKREYVIADVVTSWLAKQFPVNSQERA